MVTVKLTKKDNVQLPSYSTPRSAGVDLRAYLQIDKSDLPKFIGNGFIISVTEEGTLHVVLTPGGRILIPTGIKLAIPEGHVGDVRPRSGLALKHGITVLNADGTVDSDYRGDVGVILYNAGDRDFVIEHGDRIAQLIISPYKTGLFVEVDDLDDTVRGDGGFGSTGKK